MTIPATLQQQLEKTWHSQPHGNQCESPAAQVGEDWVVVSLLGVLGTELEAEDAW